MSNTQKAVKLFIKGVVQGVGFRPFVYRLASEEKLYGWVKNTNRNVEVLLEGQLHQIDCFKERLFKELPAIARIENIVEEFATPSKISSFKILQSIDQSDEVTSISPDIAVCNDCLADLKNQNHRINYPLINCTNCGPRFSIIRDVPYDRHNTTMSVFRMCTDCKKEYYSISNRRFHAQPIACNCCGPVYSMQEGAKKYIDINDIIRQIAKGIDDGKVYAIKGMGGFHLACDALNTQSVERIRNIKIREGKPFAVMFRNVETVKAYALVSEEEQKILTSYQRPIILLKSRKVLSAQVSLDLKTIGAMLPYMPIHYLLFEKLKTKAIVLTSGNFSDEPLIIDNEKALKSFKDKVDGILLYNREIYNRVDDSVCFVVNEKPKLIRRSRGFVPLIINLNFPVDGILATGAELTNCFCLGKENEAIMSQHIGDLKNFETYEFYTDTIERFKKLYRVRPKLVVHDLHPDYLSTKYANNQDVRKIGVQHHHAHIASCMVEHDLYEKVIGIAFDGTGYGIDGNIWGGEFLLADLDGFERPYHFEYIPMPGGDRVVKEPWRMALAYLMNSYKTYKNIPDLPFTLKFKKSDKDLVVEMIIKGINAPLTSSAGRLFDAVSALLGICTHATYHAEAPVRLEDMIIDKETGMYDYNINKDSGIISFSDTIRQIVLELKHGIKPHVISAKFHNTMIGLIVEVCELIKKNSGLNKVVLSGGVFQNRYLLEHTENFLLDKGFKVYSNQLFPANDGGLAIGQLAIGARSLLRK